MSAEPTPRAHPRSTFIATAPARAALVPLEHGLGARAPFVLLTGDAGSGRSMLARESLRRRGDRIAAALLPDPAPAPQELTASLLKMFGGIAKPGSPLLVLTERLLETLANVTAGGCVAVVLIDDAERLSDEHLLELHRITDIAAKRQCPLELLLVGTTALPARFEAPALDTVRARVSVRAALARFTPNDTREYLQMRLNAAGVPCMGMFSRKASRDIHQVSVGLVRVIEALAAESLRRAARAGSGTVSPEHVRAADHALRTGRPSEEHDTPPPSQVRAAAVEMAANSRAVPSAEVPKHAPSQATRPMGDAAMPQQARPGKHGRHQKPLRSGPGAAPIANAAPAAPTGSDKAHASAADTTGTANAAPPTADARRSAAPASTPSGTHAAPARSAPAPHLAGSHRKPAPAQPDPGSMGAFPGSDDPRVLEWIARFGGKGVRIGASHPGTHSPHDPADFGSQRMADADGVVTPARPIRRAPEARPVEQPAPAARPASPCEAVAEPGPVEGTATPVRATASEPPKAAAGSRGISQHAPVGPRLPVRRGPERRPSSAGGPRPKSPAINGALVGLVALAALAIVGISQRHVFRGLLSQAGAETASQRAVTAVTSPPARPEPAPAPETPPAPAVLKQYAIADGSFRTRDMARAECEYLGRLVPLRVRVNALGAGKGYRLLLGRFSDRDMAELAMRRIQDRGLIKDARIIEIAPLTGAGATDSIRSSSAPR